MAYWLMKSEPDELSIEGLGRLAKAAVASTGSRRRRRRRTKGRDGRRHMITSSAVSAPAWLSASRMATRCSASRRQRWTSTTRAPCM